MGIGVVEAVVGIGVVGEALVEGERTSMKAPDLPSCTTPKSFRKGMCSVLDSLWSISCSVIRSVIGSSRLYGY